MCTVMALPDSTDLTRYFSGAARLLRDNGEVTVLTATGVLLATEIGITSSVLGPQDWHNHYGTTSDYDQFMAEAFASLQDAQEDLSRAGVPASPTPSGSTSTAEHSARYNNVDTGVV